MTLLTSKNVLTKAIMAAALSISTLTVLPTHAAISMDLDEKVALVEQRLNKNSEVSYKMLERLSTHPYIDNFDYKIGERTLDKATQTATSTSELTITLNNEIMGDVTLEFVIDETIDYSDELNQQDILARVDSQLSMKEGSDALEDLTAEQKEAVMAFFKDIDMRTEFLEGTKLRTHFALPAITAEEQDGLKFGGLSVDSTYDEKTLAQGVGETHIDVKELTYIETQSEIDYDALMALPQEKQESLDYDDYPMTESVVEGLNIKPFNMDFNVSDDGKLSLDSSPIAVYLDDQNLSVLIDKITGEGNVSYDEESAQYLGAQHYTAHNVTIDGSDVPNPVVFKTMEYLQDIGLEDGLYDFETQFIATPETGTFNAFTDGSFAVNLLSYKFNVENFSQEAIEQLTQLQQQLAGENLDVTELEGEYKALIQSVFDSLSNDGATTDFNLTFSTDKGDATIDATAHLREGSDSKAWVEAIENADSGDSEALEQLLEEDLYYEAKIVVPVALLDAVGMTDMAEMMAGPFIVKEGDNFTMFIENTGKGPYVNGKSFEEIEASM